MNMVRLALLFVLLLTVPAVAVDKLRVYHVGNSITDTINYEAIVNLAKSRGKTYTLGRHTMPGTPLFGMLDNPDKGAFNKPFGRVQQALADYEWDALTLQPFDRLLDRQKDDAGKHESDLPTAIRYIELARKKSPNVQVYIYSRWPRRDTVDGKMNTKEWKPYDYQAKWLRPYTDRWDGTNETKAYFEQLTQKLNERLPDLAKPVKVIPVGDVLFELDVQAKAGNVPGLKSVEELFRDTIHFNSTGAYVAAVTFYATLFNDDPTGLPTTGYGEISPELAKAIQGTAWKVVSAQADSGT